jgi:hypothetical protein
VFRFYALARIRILFTAGFDVSPVPTVSAVFSLVVVDSSVPVIPLNELEFSLGKPEELRFPNQASFPKACVSGAR